MKIRLLVVGKTTEKYLKEGLAIYLDRLSHYTNFEMEEVSGGKVNQQQKDNESQLLLQKITDKEYVVLLDEKGKTYNSVDFAHQFLQKRLNAGQNMVFIIGGAYGFSSALYDRANEKIALSKLTFSHQMVRLFFTEQLYRGFSILKGEKYHH